MSQIINIAAYKFVSIDSEALIIYQSHLQNFCQQLELKGTILLSHEGINLMLAGKREKIVTFKDHLQKDPLFSDLNFKESISDKIPFKRLYVKIKSSIIPMPAPVDPQKQTAPHLPAQTLKQWLDEKRDIVLVDTRNRYEIAFGTFENAVHFNIEHFVELPEIVKNLSEDFKEKQIVMFCTGGIRCEKAGALFQQEGFKNVYQLDGGILRYFEQCGGAHYQGDCFVFDERVALNSHLEAVPDANICKRCSMPVKPEQLYCDTCTSQTNLNTKKNINANANAN